MNMINTLMVSFSNTFKTMSDIDAKCNELFMLLYFNTLLNPMSLI